MHSQPVTLGVMEQHDNSCGLATVVLASTSQPGDFLAVLLPETFAQFEAASGSTYLRMVEGGRERRLKIDPVCVRVFETANLGFGSAPWTVDACRTFFLLGYHVCRTLLGTSDATRWNWTSAAPGNPEAWARTFHDVIAVHALRAIAHAEDDFWQYFAEAMEMQLEREYELNGYLATDWYELGAAFALAEHDIVAVFAPELLR